MTAITDTSAIKGVVEAIQPGPNVDDAVCAQAVPVAEKIGTIADVADAVVCEVKWSGREACEPSSQGLD